MNQKVEHLLEPAILDKTWLRNWNFTEHLEEPILFKAITVGEHLNKLDLSTYDVSYSGTFNFETNFEPQVTIDWMNKYIWLPLPLNAAYIILIFSLQRFMQDRKPLKLTALLVLWNAVLALFSTWGAIRTITEMAVILSKYGFSASVCLTRGYYFYQNRVWGLWAWLFAVSKAFELVDTLFIVLRKRKLIFLHWYHHAATLFYVWTYYSGYVSTARWFMTMNYSIHSVMYTYYALRALRIPVPRFVSMTLTVSQISQMFFGLFVILWASQVKNSGNICHVSNSEIRLSLLIYASYAVLFLNFFAKAYFKGGKRRNILGNGEKSKLN